MSAQHMYETAPLGSLIRFSNGEPRPPARFTRKVKAWTAENGVGRLIERRPEYLRPTDRSPAGFCLPLDDRASAGIITIVVRRHYSVESPLQFEIIEMPRPGMVRVLTRLDDRDELRFLAANEAEAERWMASNRYSAMRAEIVPDPDSVDPVPALGRGGMRARGCPEGGEPGRA